MFKSRMYALSAVLSGIGVIKKSNCDNTQSASRLSASKCAPIMAPYVYTVSDRNGQETGHFMVKDRKSFEKKLAVLKSGGASSLQVSLCFTSLKF